MNYKEEKSHASVEGTGCGLIIIITVVMIFSCLCGHCATKYIVVPRNQVEMTR